MDARTEREVLVGERAWTALEGMAAQLATDPEVLLNQALFTFARVNGWLAPAPLALPEPEPLGAGFAEPPPEGVDVGGAAAVAGPEPEPQAAGPEAGAFERTIRRTAPAESPAKGRPEKAVKAAPGLWLEVSGKKTKVVGERFVLGRGATCQLVLQTKKASREHSAFILDAGRWVVEDLHSSNGTWVNQQRVNRAELEDGDVVLVGDLEVTVQLKPGA